MSSKADREFSEIARFERFLNQFEQDVQVDDWQVDGIAVWPLLKTSFVTAAYRARRPHNSAFYHPMFREAAAQLNQMARRNLKIADAASLPTPAIGEPLFISSRRGMKTIDGSLVSLPHDPLRKLIAEHRRRTPDLWLLDDTREPADAALMMGRPLGIRGWVAFAAMNCEKRSASAVDKFASFDLFLRRSVEAMKIPSAITRQMALRFCDQAVAVRNEARSVFEAYPPSAILMDNSGYIATTGLTAAAKSCGLPVIEVQHGVFRTSQSIDFLLNGPGRSAQPDRVFGWLSGAHKNERYVAMGSPWSLWNQLKGSDDQGRNRLPPCLRAPSHIQLISRFHDSLNWLPTLLETAAPDQVFFIRSTDGSVSKAMHAAARRFPSRVFYERLNDTPLSTLLDHVETHITDYSAVALDAACWDVPTLAYSELARTAFGAQQELMDLTIYASPAEMISAWRSAVPASRSQIGSQHRISPDLIWARIDPLI